jgi:hypothetical protein
MNNLSVRRGATLDLPVVTDDDEALTATIIIKEDSTDLSTVFSKQADFIDGTADLTLSATDTLIPVGKYLYQITV